jgi:hypothetical protein
VSAVRTGKALFTRRVFQVVNGWRRLGNPILLLIRQRHTASFLVAGIAVPECQLLAVSTIANPQPANWLLALVENLCKNTAMRLMSLLVCGVFALASLFIPQHQGNDWHNFNVKVSLAH